MDIFNEINRVLSIPYDEYFSAMDLTQEEIKKRTSLAENIEEIILFIFALLSVMRQHNYINKEYVKEELKQRYMDAVERYVGIDDYIQEYIDRFSEEIIDTTLRHIEDKWYLSNDRSILIAENESNSVYAHDDYAKAINAGKTRKRWITERDDRVRESHMEVNGVVIPIKEPFVVGGSLLLYPKDQTYSPSAEQTAGCRCTVKYY